MGVLALGVGIFTTLFVAAAVWVLARPSLRPKYWAQVERQPSLMEPGLVTRGHYVVVAAMGEFGLTFAVAGVLELSGETEHASSVTIGGVFVFAILFGLATIVARRRKPQRWIPREFREAAAS